MNWDSIRFFSTLFIDDIVIFSRFSNEIRSEKTGLEWCLLLFECFTLELIDTDEPFCLTSDNTSQVLNLQLASLRVLLAMILFREDYKIIVEKETKIFYKKESDFSSFPTIEIDMNNSEILVLLSCVQNLLLISSKVSPTKTSKFSILADFLFTLNGGLRFFYEIWEDALLMRDIAAVNCIAYLVCFILTYQAPSSLKENNEEKDSSSVLRIQEEEFVKSNLFLYDKTLIQFLELFSLESTLTWCSSIGKESFDDSIKFFKFLILLLHEFPSTSSDELQRYLITLIDFFS
jgi:hypothetical protein